MCRCYSVDKDQRPEEVDCDVLADLSACYILHYEFVCLVQACWVILKRVQSDMIHETILTVIFYRCAQLLQPQQLTGYGKPALNEIISSETWIALETMARTYSEDHFTSVRYASEVSVTQNKEGRPRVELLWCYLILNFTTFCGALTRMNKLVWMN